MLDKIKVHLTMFVFLIFFMSIYSCGEDPTEPDTQAPQKPSGLNAEAGDSIVRLIFDDNTEQDIAGYNIYRSDSSGGKYTKINNNLISLSSSPAYTDSSGLNNNATYYYVVTAVDSNGNESGYSSEISAIPKEKGLSLSLTIFDGNNQTGYSSQTLPKPLVVLVTDSEGAPVLDMDVVFNITQGSGILHSHTYSVNSGKASVKLTLGNENMTLLVEARIVDTEKTVEFTESVLLLPLPPGAP
ncbi:fibronectin type III domain-containing protein [Candidatus Latescibacterota bacterium]